MAPEIGKHPVEFFGHIWTDDSKEAKDARQDEHCPFLDQRCKKRRKSDQKVIGTCSVGYKASFAEEYVPHVICPHRLEVPRLFAPFGNLLVDDGEFFKVSEATLMGTSIDYVVGKRNEDGDILDFLGVEIQALDTTGTVWDYKVAYEDGEDISEADVERSYNMNWAMSLVKTPLQQAVKKGRAFETWGEDLVFALQDVSLAYIMENYDVSLFQDFTREHPVHFFSYSFEFDEDLERYVWNPARRLSSPIEGIQRVLQAPERDEIPSRDDFCGHLEERLGRK